jgi:hypothetical protein
VSARTLENMGMPMFSGWLRRRGGRWRRVCGAGGPGACWDVLLRMPTGPGAWEMRVLEEGDRP